MIVSLDVDDEERCKPFCYPTGVFAFTAHMIMIYLSNYQFTLVFFPFTSFLKKEEDIYIYIYIYIYMCIHTEKKSLVGGSRIK